MSRWLRLLAVLVGLHLGCLVTQARYQRAAGDAPPKAQLSLRGGRVAFCPATVEAIVRVREPGPDYVCVGERWVWGDGDVSEHEACDPGDPYLRVYAKKHIYRRAGAYTLAVMLWNGDGMLFTDHLDLDIRGGLAC